MQVSIGETIIKFGIGADIEEIGCFSRRDCIQSSAFLNRIFTSIEQEYCFSKATPAHHLAARYSGKEAIVKALASLGRPKVSYNNIEITNDADGVPQVRISKPGFDGLQIKLSLSHCEDKAIAFAIAVEVR